MGGERRDESWWPACCAAVPEQDELDFSGRPRRSAGQPGASGPVTQMDVGEQTTACGRVGWASMQGWRPYQEDVRCVFPLGGRAALCCVFDGHNGKRVADLAAEQVPPLIARTLPSEWREGEEQTSAALREAFLAFDAGLTRDQAQHCGATASVILWARTGVVVANAGDSRTVAFAAQRAKRLSTDHRPTLPTERQRIHRAGRRVQMGRIDAILGVSRGFGDLEMKDRHLPPSDMACTAYPDVLFHSFEHTPTAFVIQASDGVWDSFTDEAACKFVQDRLLGGASAGEAAAALVDASLAPAQQRGPGMDNLTAQVLVMDPR